MNENLEKNYQSFVRYNLECYNKYMAVFDKILNSNILDSLEFEEGIKNKIRNNEEFVVDLNDYRGINHLMSYSYETDEANIASDVMEEFEFYRNSHYITQGFIGLTEEQNQAISEKFKKANAIVISKVIDKYLDDQLTNFSGSREFFLLGERSVRGLKIDEDVLINIDENKLGAYNNIIPDKLECWYYNGKLIGDSTDPLLAIATRSAMRGNKYDKLEYQDGSLLLYVDNHIIDIPDGNFHRVKDRLLKLIPDITVEYHPFPKEELKNKISFYGKRDEYGNNGVGVYEMSKKGLKFVREDIFSMPLDNSFLLDKASDYIPVDRIIAPKQKLASLKDAEKEIRIDNDLKLNEMRI